MSVKKKRTIGPCRGVIWLFRCRDGISSLLLAFVPSFSSGDDIIDCKIVKLGCPCDMFGFLRGSNGGPFGGVIPMLKHLKPCAIPFFHT